MGNGAPPVPRPGADDDLAVVPGKHLLGGRGKVAGVLRAKRPPQGVQLRRRDRRQPGLVVHPAAGQQPGQTQQVVGGDVERGQGPDPGGGTADRDQAAAVGAEQRLLDGGVVQQGGGKREAGGGLPDPRCPVGLAVTTRRPSGSRKHRGRPPGAAGAGCRPYLPRSRSQRSRPCSPSPGGCPAG